jgi:hypothetical protein
MKLLTELTQEDIIKHPVWELRMIDNREYVQPSSKKEISDHEGIRYIVQSYFKLNCRTELLGFCSPQDTSGIDYIQPVIFTPNSQMVLYLDSSIEKDQTIKEMNRLGLIKSEIFPIECKPMIKCDGNLYSWIIDDFNKISK